MPRPGETDPLVPPAPAAAPRQPSSARGAGLWARARSAAAASASETRALSLKADGQVDAVLTALHLNGKWCNQIVDERQFADYPATTLLVARSCKIMLVIFICMAVTCLLMEWLFDGTVALMDEVIQVESLPGPKLALCAQPWGTKFVAASMAANLITIPTGNSTALKQGSGYKTLDCPAAIPHCVCADFSGLEMRPNGKRGELQSWDYIDLAFAGQNQDAATDQYALGFYGGNRLPQTWTYANLGYRLEGDLRYEEVAHGQTEFTDGDAKSRFSFRVSGESHEKFPKTQIQFGYDKYLIYSVSAFVSRYGVVAILSVLLMLCAAVNNFGLFDIFFPEKIDEEDPAQLGVSPALQACCFCMPCCSPSPDDKENAGKEDP